MAGLTIAGRTSVVLSRGLPDRVIPQNPGRQRVALLTQEAPEARAREIADRLESEGLACQLTVLPDREAAKTLEVASSVYERLSRFELNRLDTIVGVGGGSVTDLAGFVAGTWLRGVEVVHHPTTLLGAVDASVGGKTGVNLAGKNLIGVFWHPSLVVIDTALLESLPEDLLREGFAEAIKTGLIGDTGLFDLIREKGLESPLDQLVERSLRVKGQIVTEDEREGGRRATLNFGHTIGHAIEFASPLSHGEAVGLGMVCAAEISRIRLGFEQTSALLETLTRVGLPTRAGDLDAGRVMELVGLDKKRDDQGIRMVLLAGVGQPELVHIDESDLEAGLAAVGI